MDHLQESRRHFYFSVSKSIPFEEDGITCKNGIVKFPKDTKKNQEKFDKTFSNEDECEAWFTERFGDMKTYDLTQTQYKTFKVNFGKSTKVTSKEWDLIQAQMTVPEEFTPDDIRVYHPWVAHNFKDRDAERFRKDVLTAFKNTMSGKPILIGHGRDEPGEGRIFSAAIKKVDIEYALELIGPHPDKVAQVQKHLEEVQEMDGSILWLVAPFYVIKEQELLIRKIDAGIIRDMSIGFRAKKVEAIMDDKDKVKWWEYQDGGEALEVSFVWLGAQYGAGNRKTVKDEDKNIEKDIETEPPTEPVEEKDPVAPSLDTIEQDILPDKCFAVIEPTGEKDTEGRTMPLNARHLPHHPGVGVSGKVNKCEVNYLETALAKMNLIKPVTDKITAAELRRKAKVHLVAHAKREKLEKWVRYGGTSMKIKLESIGFEKEFEIGDEEALTSVFGEIEKECAVIVTEAGDADEKVTELQPIVDIVKTTFGENFNLETLADDMAKLFGQAEVGKKSKETLIDDVVQLKLLTGFLTDENDKVKDEKELLAGLTADQLVVMKGQFQAKYDAEHPLKSTTPNPAKEPEEKEKKRSNIPDSRYRTN